MMLKGAIIDLDGTLIDSMYIWDCLAKEYLVNQGIDVDDSINEIVKTMSLEEAAKYFKTTYHLSLSTKMIIQGIDDLLEKYYREVFELKAGVKQFLDILKNNQVKMCIATATNEHLVNLVLKKCQINNYFDHIFTCQQLNCNKHEPTIYNEALKFLNLSKQEVAVFEDSYHAAKTAKDNGYFVVGIYDKYENNQEKLKEICDVYLLDYLKITEIEKILNLQ